MEARPSAAIGVRIGKTFRYIGSIKPMAPAIFERQINNTISGEYSLSQDSFDANLFLNKIMISPDNIKTVASMP